MKQGHQTAESPPTGKITVKVRLTDADLETCLRHGASAQEGISHILGAQSISDRGAEPEHPKPKPTETADEANIKQEHPPTDKVSVTVRLTAAELLACLRIGPTSQQGILHLIHHSTTYFHAEEGTFPIHPTTKKRRRRRNNHHIKIKLVLTMTQISILLRFGKTPKTGLFALIETNNNKGKGRANGKGRTRGEYEKNSNKRKTLSAWQVIQNAKIAKKKADDEKKNSRLATYTQCPTG